MLKQLTRVLIFAGIAILANHHGTSTGGPGHLLAAEPKEPPAERVIQENGVIQANSEFAFDSSTSTRSVASTKRAVSFRSIFATTSKARAARSTPGWTNRPPITSVN